MDPFIQGVLERAQIRREKLDHHLSNGGHDIIRRRRSPLKDANAILAKIPAINQQLKSKSPKKALSSTSSSKSSSPAISPVKSTRKSPVKIQEETKENEEVQVSHVRTQLKRLGKLYSEDGDRELSSPIHKTEETFLTESETSESKSTKSGARLNRLAALASTINNWEDDLSHPTLIKPTTSKAEKIQAKLNEQVRNADQQSGSNGSKTFTRRSNQSPGKPLKWDKTVLDTLEAQGFSRSESNSRLVYDYEDYHKDCSQASPKSKAPGGSPNKFYPEAIKTKQKVEEISRSPKNRAVIGSPSGSSRFNEHISKTPEKTVKASTSNSSVSSTRAHSRYGFNGSPKSPMKQSPGSVLSKASMFESKSNINFVKVRDPAEMTLSERKALFEKNKGEALIPKAPLTMSVPTKKLMEKEKATDNRMKTDTTETGKPVAVQKSIYEQGYTQELENNILQSIQNERQKELEMLRTRFNKNKEVATVVASSVLRTSESSEGKSVSPKNHPVCPVKPTPAPQDHIPPPPPLPQNSGRQTSSKKNIRIKRQAVSHHSRAQNLKTAEETKRLRICTSKPGNIYPDLAEIESVTTDSGSELMLGNTEAETATLDEQTETETETEADFYLDDDRSDYESEEESEGISNTSLGRSILHAVSQKSALNERIGKQNAESFSDSSSDASVLEEMDDYLDECLAKQAAHEDGPTPPKLNRGIKNASATSLSFKYTQGSSYQAAKRMKSPSVTPKENKPQKIEKKGEEEVTTPLTYSVSFYRRQQSQTPKTPVKLISRIPINSESFRSLSYSNEKEEQVLVQEKVKRLLEEVCKQQTTIGQASQALNLCNATVEFSGSQEQVEGERLLLLATHRRQAALNEIQRLKVEGTLKPAVPGSSEAQENGSLTISAITLPLKRENIRNLDYVDKRLHFVCLVRHMENVISTPVIQMDSRDSCLRFSSTLKIDDLDSDFKITVEIYSLETRAEILPHEIKYHIHNNGATSAPKKVGGSKTPKKFLKHESKLCRPTVQSPAGPSAVRSSAFLLAGYVVFSLKEVSRQQFTLNKVPPNSPLEGQLQMRVSCELSVSIEHRGFLTMFEELSGFGAWHRRWCLLKGDCLSYWKYPEDERKKVPIGSIALKGIITTNVSLISRDICARPNTFSLESVRPAQPGDVDSIITVCKGSNTIIRHLLSADTKEERLEWCAKLNKTLYLIRSWSGTSTSS